MNLSGPTLPITLAFGSPSRGNGLASETRAMGRGNEVPRTEVHPAPAQSSPSMEAPSQQLRIPVDLATHEALTEWAAEVGIGVEELSLRLLTRYLRPPHAERDPVDDRIGEILLARMGREGHISVDAVARFREAAKEMFPGAEPAPPIVTPRAQQLAEELSRSFSADSELAGRLAAAGQKLRAANERLWSGLAPEGLQAIYGDHPQFDAIQLEAAVDSRSEVLESADLLGELQKVHWEIHRAYGEHQEISEDRRHLAAEIGEQIAAMVAELVDGGFSEEQARNVDVHQLASTGRVGDPPAEGSS